MEKLNTIKINLQESLELIVIGGTDTKIILFNCLNLKIYQIIKEHEDTVYSLAQYKNDPNYLFSSSKDSTINIFRLENNYKYKLIKKLRKQKEKEGGPMNKIIILSNKLLISSDDLSITVWKSNNNQDEGEINYEEIYEIITKFHTCHLLEVNPSILAATQYNCFQVYNTLKDSFPLIGQLNKIKSLASSSNDLSKINDNIVCLGSNSRFYIISIIPLQIIQKIIIPSSTVYFIYITKDYIYCKGNKSIVQYKIINGNSNNFVEIKQIDKIDYDNEHKAILPLDDGRIFYIEKGISKNYLKLIA